MKLCHKNIVLVFIIILIITLVFINNKRKTDVLRIAYNSDISGYIFEDIANDNSNEINLEKYDFMDLGDCCGSSAQFAMATNQIDIAVLCDDAIKYLQKINNDNYLVFGNITYDSEVLITNKKKSEIKIVGYMNRREQQRNILKNYFSDTTKLVPMSPLSLGYALESKVIDAAYVDIGTYLQLDYEGTTLTNNNITQKIVVNKKAKDNINIKKIIKLYNKKVLEIKNDDILFNFLSKYLKLSNKEVVLKKWKSQKIKFGMLEQEN